MLFHSYHYVFVLLPAALLLYRLLRMTRWHNLILLIASYLFYVWGHPYLIFFILSSSLIDFWVGCQLGNTENPRRRAWLLGASVTFNLGMLVIFKYAGWVSKSLNQTFFYWHLPLWLPEVDLPLPPGISFYTFQALSYTIDVYRHRFEPHRNLTNFLTYIAFFPQLIAGPIERPQNLLTQISTVRDPVNDRRFESAIFLIVWGIFKKVVFADNLGHVVKQCFGLLPDVPGIGFVIVFAFCFQIYCDFSAYTDIARGSARLFNIELTRNFMTPYFAVSPSDFWKRWHISLSTWIRDYVYTPLFVKLDRLRPNARLFVTLILTMTVMGLWHGAGIFFVIWGLYHGFLLALYHVFPIDRILEDRFRQAGRWMAVLIMFFLINVAWLLFISDPSSRFPAIVKNLISAFQTPVRPEIYTWLYPALLFSVPVMITEILGYRKRGEFVDLYDAWPFWGKVAVYYLIFYGICVFGKRETYEFIYFAF